MKCIPKKMNTLHHFFIYLYFQIRINTLLYVDNVFIRPYLLLVIQILILVLVTFAGTRSNSSDNIFAAVLREEEEFKQEMTSQCDAVMSKRDDPMTYCTIVCQVRDDHS